MSSNDWLAGKHALLTGAGAGLGVAVAQAFLDAGARCTLCAADRSPSAAVEALRSIAGSRVHYLCCEAPDAHAFERLLPQAHTRFGAMHIFFNHATCDLGLRSAEVPVRVLQAATQAALRYLLACELRGSVVNVAVLPRLVPEVESQAGFHAALALLNFTREAARDVAHHGIRVNGLVVRDDRRQAACNANRWLGVPGLDREPTARSPAPSGSGRTTRVEEAVHAALFLASDRSGSLTAQTLDLDCTSSFSRALHARG